FQKDGALAVDSTKLSSALSANPDGVQRLLMGTTSAPGVMASVSSGIDGFNDATQGVLALAQSGTSQTITDLQKNETAVQAQIDATIANYRQQFIALDTIMSNLTATGNYLTQQFNAMSSSSSSSGSKG
ncbi:MAG TPA: flagellar filament capping protein FliD, partial [Ramlibacter sp.]|nr:flagellar filament capping protein FliD [Ramlibacter sp.]